MNLVEKASFFTVADNVEHFLWIDFRYLGNQRLSEDKEKCFKERGKLLI